MLRACGTELRSGYALPTLRAERSPRLILIVA